jgi:aspartate aminotransferase
VRVGWVLGPVDVISAMNNFLGHVGTWAPRAEQVATAQLLLDEDAISEYRQALIAGVQARLDALFHGIKSLRTAGHPVDAIAPQGAIYLSARFDLYGRTTPAGTSLRTNEDIRAFLLQAAGMAMVPFQAFGAEGESGWCRLSVGAASPAEIDALLPRLRAALESLR